MDNHLKTQSGRELLEKAIEQWNNSVAYGNFEGEKGVNGVLEDELNSLRNDPVINLMMNALSYQTNLLKEQVTGLKEDLLGEYIRQTAPYHLVRPVPAITIMRAQLKKECTDPFVWADESCVMNLEKKSKTKTKFKENEHFPFMPLFKTKVLNAFISSVNYVGENTFELTFSVSSPIQNLSGLSFFFPILRLESLSVFVNDVQLPVISMKDCDQLPLCDCFDTSHSVFGRSLLYGTPESWMDTASVYAGRLFYIGDYDEKISDIQSVRITLQTNRRVRLSIEDVFINCFPIVNVEKRSTSLSVSEPIRKIAVEKLADDSDNQDNSSRVSTRGERLFLNLLAPADKEYDAGQITLRRFGAERYHVGKLVEQANALVHRYSSDYYAFSEFANVQFDEKMNALRNQLKEIDRIISENHSPRSGVYVMINQNQKRGESIPQRLAISYLLTDGKSGNNIMPGAILSLPSVFDSKSEILDTTFGGRDEVSEESEIRTIAQYYSHTQDRLVTRADIKKFCIKELVTVRHLKRDQIKKVSVTPGVSDGKYGITVEIQLVQKPTMKISEDLLNKISDELQCKIAIRSSDFVNYRVHFIIVESCETNPSF